MGVIKTKRIYDAPDSADGYRILVDRIWPRGVSKDAARLDLWMKDITPSPELRQYFCHDPALFAEFRIRYCAELDNKPDIIAQLLDFAQQQNLTLLYAAKDPAVNHAIVLADYLREQASTA